MRKAKVTKQKVDIMLKWTLEESNCNHTTVDGRNPAPPDMYETLRIMGYLPYQPVQHFFHQHINFHFPSDSHTPWIYPRSVEAPVEGFVFLSSPSEFVMKLPMGKRHQQATGFAAELLTPQKINVEHNDAGLVQIFFLAKWVICRFHVNLPGFILFHD